MLCGQDILLIIYDQEFQKVYQYRSDENFDIGRAKELLDSGLQAGSGKGNRRRRQQAAPSIKVFDYSNKDLKKFAKDDKDSDAEDGLDFEEEPEENKEVEEMQPVDTLLLSSPGKTDSAKNATPIFKKESSPGKADKSKKVASPSKITVGKKRKHPETELVEP